MDAMDEQPLHLQRDMTHAALRRFFEARTELTDLASVLIVGVDSTHIEACMTMSVRRRRATRTALVTSDSSVVKNGLEDPDMVWAGSMGGGVWHRPSHGASSRSGGVWYSGRKGHRTIPYRAKIRNPGFTPARCWLVECGA